MNRTEFNETLDQVCKDIMEAGGNMVEFEPMDPKSVRMIAAAALMAADRYYSNLTKLMVQREERNPMRKGEHE